MKKQPRYETPSCAKPGEEKSKCNWQTARGSVATSLKVKNSRWGPVRNPWHFYEFYFQVCYQDLTVNTEKNSLLVLAGDRKSVHDEIRSEPSVLLNKAFPQGKFFYQSLTDWRDCNNHFEPFVVLSHWQGKLKLEALMKVTAWGVAHQNTETLYQDSSLPPTSPPRECLQPLYS